jgi:serine/threonine protein kinase
MVNECKDVQKELDQLAKPKDAPYQPELEISEDKHKQILRLRLRNALRKALRPILNHKDTLENRVHYAKVVRTYLNHVQSCVRSSKQNPLKVALYEEKEGQLKEIIYFDRRIGSESVYGTAYLNAGKGLARILKFSIKIMSDRFTSEVNLLNKMSQLAEKGISPNMPITYAVKKCISPTDTTLLKNPTAIDLMKAGGYYVVLNELANGDTHDFFKFVYSDRVYVSIITQMLFSLQAFHNLGYVHNDAHLGNFLWHKITAGGFWQYKYGNTTIYVPNTGYLMVLWDPGLAKTKKPYVQLPNTDIDRVLRLLMSIPTSRYYQEKKMIGINRTALQPFEAIHHTMKLNPRGFLSASFMNAFLEILVQQKKFKHIYYKTSTVNILPSDSIILNKIPYKL